MARYDPRTNQAKVLRAPIPGERGTLRACTRVDSRGIAYGLSYREAELFAFDTNTEKTRVLGRMVSWPDDADRQAGYAYTADIQLSPDERYLYSVPRSHGGAERVGTPVVQFDLKTNKAKALCELFEPLAAEAGYAAMGSFGASLSDDGKLLLVVWNGCHSDWKTAPGRQISFQDARNKPYKFDVVGITLLRLP